MEERFILGQQALTPDGAVYQIIWDEPYDERTTPELVAQGLPNRAPDNTVAGSTCIFNTEGEDGYPVEWLFAFDGTNWALERVVRGGSAGGDGYRTAQVEFILEGISSAVVYGAFTDPLNGTVYGKRDIPSSNYKAAVLCSSNGAPSEIYVLSNSIFAQKQGGVILKDDHHAWVIGDGTITISGGGQSGR